MTRLAGWEERLAAVIESARNAPYDLGRHDCLRVACHTVQALTGTDYWQQFSGRYASKREALAVIAEMGKSFADAVTLVTQIAPSAPAYARRGDIVLYRDESGEHLGVCNGAQVAVLGPQGLAWLPLTDPGITYCWRIG